MALVCDIKSETVAPENEDEDLEDGEIEDDDEVVEEAPAAGQDNETVVQHPNIISSPSSKEVQEKLGDEKKRDRTRDRSREKRAKRAHREKDTRHMTEAERSILHLRRKERMEREKWTKFRKEQVLEPQVEDDFAINLEKTLASILKKDRGTTTTSDEDEERRASNKRKKREHNTEQQQQQHKSKKTKNNDGMIDENERTGIGSPSDKDERVRSHSDDSEYSSDHSSRHDEKTIVTRGNSRRDSRREHRKTSKNKTRDRNFKRDRSRDKKTSNEPVTDSKGICIFYLNGKCNKNDCIYSHEAVPPMKLELCKFYLMDCCAKGENCSYMHSDFPCKFYHMGLTCTEGDNCKFAHGKPLTDGLKQILFKHIETAPRDILGGFPRLSREETLNMMDTTQKNLTTMYQERNSEEKPETKSTDDKSSSGDGSIPCLFDLDVPVPTELKDVQTETKTQPKPGRNRKSRWQDAEPSEKITPNVTFSPFNFTQDQDMRINSNGDIDMRTLPPHPMNSLPQPLLTSLPVTSEPKTEVVNKDTDTRNMGTNSINFSSDIDIRFPAATEPAPFPGNQDVDIRCDPDALPNIPANLPKTQRELFLRIQAQQRENPTGVEDEKQDDEPEVPDTNWYSDDDDDDDENRLTIKVDAEETTPNVEDERQDAPVYEPPPKPVEVVEKFGDLSKINITADITKLLSTLSANIAPPEKPKSADPRLDPRRGATPSEQTKSGEKMSIYEQGGLDLEDIDISSVISASEEVQTARPDVDLRTLGLPFKGIQNYTPATEIDASVSSHPPLSWKVAIVDIPRPDYSGLKLSISDAEKTGDPRLRKIFRLSVEEKDTPASPKESPRSSGTVRVDPRLRKVEEVKSVPMFESPAMNYTQQLNTLQSSAFYQSLTSNQKLMLNQELASRADQSGSHDPMLNSLLSNLNLIPGVVPNNNVGGAISILQGINKMSNGGLMAPTSMLNPGLLQPGLLGAAPGIPNIPQDFPPIGFAAQNGLLGTVPPQFTNFDTGPPPGGNFQNYPNDDFYQQQENNQVGGGNFRNQRNDNRGCNFNRDRRRGGRNNNFNRNQGNRNQFRRNQGGGNGGGNNRSNRAHTPP